MEMSAPLQFHPYRLRCVEPLRIGDHVLSHREGWLVECRMDNGPSAWGDIAPLPGLSVETREWVERALPDAAARWSMLCEEGGDMPWPSSVTCGIEMALFNSGHPDHLPQGLAGWIPWRPSIPLSGLLSGAPDTMRARAVVLAKQGFTNVKIKVGRHPLNVEIPLVKELATLLGPAVSLRMDANRAWTPSEASRAVEAWRALNVDYYEEPLRAGTQLMEWMQESGAPLALDETLMDMMPEDLDVWRGIRAVVLKPTVLGGLSRTRAWTDAALGIDAQPVISATYESGVGILSLARFTAALSGGRESAAAGLDTYRALAEDVCTPRLAMDRGSWTLEEMNFGHYQMSIT